MKKFLLLFVAVLGVFLLSSCKDPGDLHDCHDH